MKLILILTSVLLAGCATSKMWSHAPVYDETIVGFYLVEGKHEVVAVGKKYNYLFKVKPEMYKAFQISSEYDFSLSFDQFKIYFDNRISGRFSLRADKSKLSESKRVSLEQLGFGSNGTGIIESRGKDIIMLSRYISGTRYKADSSIPMTQFENGYKVAIKGKNEGLLYAGKAVITPLTLAIDTLVLIPIVLSIVVFDLDVSGTRHD